jgi:hypothetical protein
MVTAGAAAASVAAAAVAAAPAGAATRPAVLAALACRSASRCVAVGVNTPAMPTRLLSDQWNGRRWSRGPMPGPRGAANVRESGVACPSATGCVAVGVAFPPSARDVTLYGVSCHAATCLAAGADNDGTSPGTYLLNGTTWSLRSAPAPRGAAYPALQSVSCPAAGQCLAVGNYGGNGVFADRWNGRAWAGVPMHQFGGVVRYFEQVRCVAPDSCVALGSSSALGASWRSASAYWNGRSWQVTPAA